jgi:hypothetical protein
MGGFCHSNREINFPPPKPSTLFADRVVSLEDDFFALQNRYTAVQIRLPPPENSKGRLISEPAPFGATLLRNDSGANGEAERGGDVIANCCQIFPCLLPLHLIDHKTPDRSGGGPCGSPDR